MLFTVTNMRYYNAIHTCMIAIIL